LRIAFAGLSRWHRKRAAVHFDGLACFALWPLVEAEP
jgi:hypothetical protein